MVAGPMTGMHLADLGAEVIKIEPPKVGDDARRWGFTKNGVGLFYKVINRNKRAITLNLRTPKGQDLVRRMAANTDVVIASFRPATLERWGIGYEDLKRVNPRIVMTCISGFGRTGPYAPRPGFGAIAEGLSGFVNAMGFPDRPPLLPGFALGDASTSIFAAFSTMAALYHRDCHGGPGQMIDVALYEGMFTLLGSHVIDFDQLGVVQQRCGNQLSFSAPRSLYQTADGAWVVIAAGTQVIFERLMRAIGAGTALEDPRFANNEARLANVDALDEIVQGAVRRFKQADLLERLKDSEAAVGPVYNVRDIISDPHYVARQNVVAVEDEELGTIRMQSVTPRLSETPGRIRSAGPPLGKHNKEIFQELLGLSDQELEALKKEGVV
jgi:crotonobetainyl-CoA:carnitine CoA-transferase CaiB-like acyl-CoA transferase